MTTPQDYLYKASHNSFKALQRIEEISNALQVIERDDDMQAKSLILKDMMTKIDNLDKKVDLIIFMLKAQSNPAKE